MRQINLLPRSHRRKEVEPTLLARVPGTGYQMNQTFTRFAKQYISPRFVA
jgi:hypothetical protein